MTSGSIDPSSVTTVVFFSMPAVRRHLAARSRRAAAHDPSLAPHPATVLGLIGLAFAARQPMALDWIQAGVALFLVVAGAAMVLRRQAR